MTSGRIIIALATSAMLSVPAIAAPVPTPTPKPMQQVQKLPPNCGAAVAVNAQLQKEGLAPIAAGLVGDNILFTIFASADRTAWAATTTNTRGVSCAIATGHTWMSAKPKFPYAHGKSDT